MEIKRTFVLVIVMKIDFSTKIGKNVLTFLKSKYYRIFAKNITIRDIIYSRIDFIENNNIFDKKEYMYVNKGEIEAYSEILTDIELLTIDAFVEKYLCILKKVSEKLDNEHNLGDNEQERMSGYNNAIVFVLSLINPIYEYELE